MHGHFLRGLLVLAGFLYLMPVTGQYNPWRKEPDIPYANTGQLGFTFGPTFYAGELNAGNFKINTSTSIGASFYGQYQISNVFGFRTQLLGGFLNGGTLLTEKEGKVEEESFSGVFLDFSLNGLFTFTNLITPYRSSRNYFGYTILGLGYAGWYSKLDSKIYYVDSLASDNPLQNFNGALVLPLGVGFQYRFGRRLNLGLEYTARFVFSDKLDNTPGAYPNDIIHYLSLGVSLNLGTGKGASKAAGKPQMQPADPYQTTYAHPSRKASRQRYQQPVYSQSSSSTSQVSPGYSPTPVSGFQNPATNQAFHQPVSSPADRDPASLVLDPSPAGQQTTQSTYGTTTSTYSGKTPPVMDPGGGAYSQLPPPPQIRPPSATQVTGREGSGEVLSGPAAAKQVSGGDLPKQGVYFFVQLFAISPGRHTPAWVEGHYGITEPVWVERAGSVERFLAGRCSNVECARRLKADLAKKGLRDTFIVRYRDGRREAVVK